MYPIDFDRYAVAMLTVGCAGPSLCSVLRMRQAKALMEADMLFASALSGQHMVRANSHTANFTAQQYFSFSKALK
jgi:hypothetical protein